MSQQAAQCVLGYWMADKNEVFVSAEYAIAVWARRIRYTEAMAIQSMQCLGLSLPWIVKESKGWESASASTLIQVIRSSQIDNLSQIESAQMASTATFPHVWELLIAKTIYWIFAPLLQYLSAMILADSMQYFTHRAFHVNKWLYSTYCTLNQCPVTLRSNRMTELV